MSEVQGIEQQTQHWLEWRRGRIGSSDACIIMQSVDWSTPRELFFDKLGINPRRKKRSSSHVMNLGNEFEPKARALYELQSGLDFRPAVLVCMEHQWRIASLDGFNAETGKRIILEIKCVQGNVFDYAKRGEMHPKYKPQVQHQLDVAKADECHFFVAKLGKKYGRYFIEDTALVIVKPDLEYQQEQLLKMETIFHEHVKNKIPPPLTAKDYYMVEHDDQSTVILFARLKEAKLALKDLEDGEVAALKAISNIQERKVEAQALFDALKDEAVKHIDKEIKHPKVSCVGVNMVRNKNGIWSVNLEAPEKVLQGHDPAA